MPEIGYSVTEDGNWYHQYLFVKIEIILNKSILLQLSRLERNFLESTQDRFNQEHFTILPH